MVLGMSSSCSSSSFKGGGVVSSPRAIIPTKTTKFTNNMHKSSLFFSKKWCCSPTTLVSHLCIAIMAFHAGLLAGYSSSMNNNDPCPVAVSSGTRTTTTMISGIHSSPEMQLLLHQQQSAQQPRDLHETGSDRISSTSTSTTASLFSSTTSSFAVGMGRVQRNDFAAEIDLGVPVDASTTSNQEVLLLYGPNSMPTITSATADDDNSDNNGGNIPLYRNVTQAMAQCNSLKVILTQPDTLNGCIAIMGQWESYHVHKFLRLPQPGGVDGNGKKIKFKARRNALNSSIPLRYVSRTHRDDGIATSIPNQNETIKYYKLLTEYLVGLPDSLERLRPIAAKVASNDNGDDHNSDYDGQRTNSSKRPIVVLVCNFGQSELLMNFVCSARARGLDLSQVLLFATDSDTTLLAKSLGLAVFEVGNAFGKLPKGSAKKYGDAIFSGMMMSKVYCVHMISSLGYDLLFQDVDVVWYRNPTTYFQNTSLSGDFDIYFQDDGAHSPRYRPYSPNSGFYYVRHNERTEYFFSVFARMGDLIQKSGSHQSAMNALLTEHASWRGLRIKVFGRETAESDLFPGGFHFHRRLSFMKQLVQGQIPLNDNASAPFVFHMSWTTNKLNKIKFFQQLGDWYTQDVCIQKVASKILSNQNDKDTQGQEVVEQNEQQINAAFISKCCSAEPIVVCHYSDKPSKIPCRESPTIDKNGRSFW